MQAMRTDSRGSGPPLVLIGGGLTGWLSWIPHQERLAAGRRVVRAQPLSVEYGLDDRPLPPDYSVDAEADALAAALDQLDLVGPVDLAAWSYGAAITLDFALDHPRRVRTLTLIEPPAFWTLAATGHLDDQSLRESDAIRALYARMTVDVSEAQLEEFVAHVALVPPGVPASELPQWPSWVEHRRSLRAGDAPWRHADSAERLRAFTPPVLLVKGTGSSHFLHRIIDALAATLPTAELLELPGGHAPQLAAFDPFLDHLVGFLDGPGAVR